MTALRTGPAASDQYMIQSANWEDEAIDAMSLDDPGLANATVYALLSVAAAVRALRETVEGLRGDLP